jgi:hypothetical protein
MKEAYYIFDSLTKKKQAVLKRALYSIPGILYVTVHADGGTVKIEYEGKKPETHLLKTAGGYALAPFRVEIKSKREIRKLK